MCLLVPEAGADNYQCPVSPNKYKARVAQDRYNLSNVKTEANVEFRTLAQSGVEPPNPEFLRVHAAFAKVLDLCGAAQYAAVVESEVEEDGMLRPDGETDLGLLLTCNLATIMAR